ncbi:type I CRISPR-associated protein Cas7 [Fervidibacillus albus]|uniref:Type I CRISPR-associated protein Cas7 n=1 Tax=Fervidibacillus albus TaxID=2980026 RepID=A0A9E8LUP8_9BACI|nr:type I CRISPR-associated protein Cas7 [Fervidibacillus albus]WAA09832.1 type I CRISPR-associated protein Cas7 [Fervidibacillus albus]
MGINNGEFIFIKSVKDGIPNRDPLQDSDARRLFPEEDGRISLSDVSIKRDVRDYVISAEPDGGNDKKNYIFVQEKVNEKGKLLGRGSLAESIAKEVGKEKEAKTNMKSVLIDHCFDVRTFGIVYSVKPKFNLTGPVQFGWAHSLHPVDSQYIQGTVVMPSSDIKNDGDEGKTQGTIWTSYIVPFALFAMPGVINAKIAEQTKMSKEDQELLLKALWQGTQHRQARGRGQQQPLLLVHVEYNDPYFRIGYLEDLISMNPGEEVWRNSGKRPSSIKDVSINVEAMLEKINMYKDKIANVRIWVHPSLKIEGNIDQYKQPLW